jgi:type II secretory pathway predicted ATPase ExeA
MNPTPAPWVSHFGLSRIPFQKTLATSDLIQRPSHQEAVARLRFCISEALVGVITGEVGVGKTVAVRAATDPLDPSSFHVVYLPNPLVGARGLYVTIVRALGAQPRFFKAEVVAQAQTLLAMEDLERRRRVVLAIDEAHLLRSDQLEELRLLTSAEMDSRSHFALLLVGQPMLARQLRMGSYAALDQRIATRYQIQPMDLEESVRYVRHRLQLAGRQEPLFADDALARLHRAGLGLPRQLNNLCISALIAAAGQGKSLVDDECAKQAVAELNRDKE